MLIDRIKRIAIAAFLAFFVGYSLHLFIARNKAEKELAVAIEQRNKAAADAILSKRMADALLERIEIRELALVPSISPSLERACAVLAGTRNPQEPTSTPIVPSSALVKLPEVLSMPEASKELPSMVRSTQSCE